ncbi:MAG: 50S ribosomal protein L2 [bacterium]|nr:50S ribosomal protein L2 [bacterium]
MGKNLIQQKRGKGSTAYRAPSFRYVGEVKHKEYTEEEQKNVIVGKIVDFVHSSGHSAPVAKVLFEDGKESLMPAPQGVRVGDNIETGNAAKIKEGNTTPLTKIPEGTLIYNIENTPGDGGKFVRTSGGFARVLSKTKDKITVMLPSKKQHTFHPNCRASIGIIAGSGRTEKPFMKAGTRYHKMKARNKLYPKVCAVSMNAVDHPYGGSSSAHKGKPTIARKNAPAGAKVGMIRPRRSGRKRKS